MKEWKGIEKERRKNKCDIKDKRLKQDRNWDREKNVKKEKKESRNSYSSSSSSSSNFRRRRRRRRRRTTTTTTTTSWKVQTIFQYIFNWEKITVCFLQFYLKVTKKRSNVYRRVLYCFLLCSLLVLSHLSIYLLVVCLNCMPFLHQHLVYRYTLNSKKAYRK